MCVQHYRVLSLYLYFLYNFYSIAFHKTVYIIYYLHSQHVQVKVVVVNQQQRNQPLREKTGQRFINITCENQFDKWSSFSNDRKKGSMFFVRNIAANGNVF